MNNILTFALAIIMTTQSWSTKPPASSDPSVPGNGNVAVTNPSASAGSFAIANSSSFPTTGVLDSFNRKDGTIGTKWSIDRSEFKISSNRLRVAKQGMILWKPTSFGPDQEAYITFVHIDAKATDMDLLLKSQSSESRTSLLEVIYKPALKVIQVKSYTKAKGFVQHGANIPVTFVDGDVLGARATADGHVYVYKNGVSLAGFNITSWPDYAKGGYVGLLSWGSSNPVYDNFGGGTIVTSGTRTPAPNPTATRTAAASNTPGPTATKTSAPTVGSTPAATNTSVPVATNTARPTATVTSAPTVGSTPAATNTSVPVATNTAKPTATVTSAPIVGNTPAATNTSVPVATNTGRPTATVTSAPTVTSTPAASATNTLSPTTAFTATFTPTVTTANTPTQTVTLVPTNTFTRTSTPTQTNTVNPNGFTFASLGDSQNGTSQLLSVDNAIAALNPNLVLFNGDLADSSGVTTSEMTSKTGVYKTTGLFDKTFFVRGNHDNNITGSANLWETFFSTYPNVKFLPNGVTNYVAIDSNSTYLTYSFIYQNSMFLGVDVPGDADLITSAQYTFLDQRLTYAESIGLTHAFIWFHGGEYCVESTHCGCASKLDGSCTPTAFVNLINKHPVVSATFHGHEHILGWIHMDSSRVPSLTKSYEEFFTSPSAADITYNSYIYPNRVDYYSTSNNASYAGVSVNGNSFTVTLYKVGTGAVWSKTFTKGPVVPTNTPTVSPTPTRTNTPSAPTVTRTSTPTIVRTPTQNRATTYYVVDRVRSNTDFALLASWGINTAIVDFKVAPQSGTIAQWDSVVNAAAAAGIKIVIWPDGHQGSDVSGCRWETPFDKTDIGNGTDYIINVKPILDHFGNNPNVIGIVTAHEPVWIQNATTEAACNENIAGMTIIKTQIHDYINNTVHRNASYAPFKVWNYIDNIYNISNLSDYNATNKAAQIEGIMDVAVIWQHCAGYPTYAGDGSACEGSGHYTALGGINYDRNTMIVPNGLEGKVEEVFIMQTFKQGSSGAYAGKFTLSELENYSCDFVNSGSLDGFGFYTWDEGWYTGNLKSFTDLQPAIPYIHSTCVH